MALSDDQRAMLQLLLERGQSYDDLASLLGVDRAEMRVRARATLTELSGQDPDTDVALSDYLLGEADPISRADTVRHLQADADSLALADELSSKLRLIAPGADLPELPQGKRGVRPSAPRAGAGGAPPSSGPSRLSQISTRQARIFVALGASAVLVIVAVLAITGAFGGDDGGGTTTADASAGNGSVATEDGTRIVMTAQGNSQARGQAVLGFTTSDQPFIDLQLSHLPQAKKGEAYILWFLLDDKTGFPLPAALPIKKDGTFSQQLALPDTVYSIVAQMQALDVSIVDSKSLASEIDAAIKGGQGVLNYEGNSVLRGTIPASAAASIPPATTGSTTPTPTTPTTPTTPPSGSSTTPTTPPPNQP